MYDIVLLMLDFFFGSDAALIVCAKWLQADNISTDAHKVMTCHRALSAGFMAAERSAGS